MRKYIGGDLGWAQRLPLIKRYLRSKPTHDFGPRSQCYCGSTKHVRFRQRWYCPRCGRRTDASVAVAQILGAPEKDAPNHEEAR